MRLISGVCCDCLTIKATSVGFSVRQQNSLTDKVSDIYVYLTLQCSRGKPCALVFVLLLFDP